MERKQELAEGKQPTEVEGGQIQAGGITVFGLTGKLC